MAAAEAAEGLRRRARERGGHGRDPLGPDAHLDRSGGANRGDEGGEGPAGGVARAQGELRPTAFGRGVRDGGRGVDRALLGDLLEDALPLRGRELIDALRPDEEGQRGVERLRRRRGLAELRLWDRRDHRGRARGVDSAQHLAALAGEREAQRVALDDRAGPRGGRDGDAIAGDLCLRCSSLRANSGSYDSKQAGGGRAHDAILAERPDVRSMGLLSGRSPRNLCLMPEATWQDVLAAELTEGNWDGSPTSPWRCSSARFPCCARTATCTTSREPARWRTCNSSPTSCRATWPWPTPIRRRRRWRSRASSRGATCRCPSSRGPTGWSSTRCGGWGVDEIRRRLADDRAVALAVEQLTDATFANRRGPDEPRARALCGRARSLVRSADALRRETVEALLDGDAVDVDTRLRAAALRRAPRARRLRHLERGRGRRAESSAGRAGRPWRAGDRAGPNAIAGCHPEAMDLAAADGAHATISAPGEGLDGFRRVHAEAREAQRIAKLAGLDGTTRYEDVALAALLTSDLEQARVRARFAARARRPAHGGPARRRDGARGPALAGQPAARGAGLGAREHGRQRVKTAERLLGPPHRRAARGAFAALLIDRVVSGGLGV